MIKKTKKKAKKELLNDSEIRYRRLFETAHDGILILDSKTGQITDVNPYLEKLLGYTKDEFLNKKLWEVGAFKNMKASRDAFSIIQKEGYIRYEDLPLEAKSGELIEVEFVSNSYVAGGVLVIQCNVRDITERRKVDLIKETRRLLEDERSKVRSIADATHELRTPLAVIKGNVDLVLRSKGKDKKSANSALRAIDYEIKHLTGILSDLSLITSRSWELKSRISYEQIKIKPFVTTVIKRCRAFSIEKKISITTGKIANLVVIGDRLYLERMLMNLVRNSTLYGNDKGHTIIEVKKSQNTVVISVTDDGIGISKEELPHVFERFYRVDKFHKSGGNSIGLGLAIVKWVAEIHGGSVSAKSVKGKGSVFSVTLPIKATT
jgi:PAS domain S-box-containing protein